MVFLLQMSNLADHLSMMEQLGQIMSMELEISEHTIVEVLMSILSEPTTSDMYMSMLQAIPEVSTELSMLSIQQHQS